jgi:hypothetical protein
MRRRLYFKLKSPHPVPLPAGRGEGVDSNCAITNWFYLATFKHYCGYEINLTAIDIERVRITPARPCLSENFLTAWLY